MSKKKNKTPEERAMHEEAVRLRKMTDKQLVEQFHRAAEPEMASSPSHKAEEASKDAMPNENTSEIQKLLTALSKGECKGIKGATVYKISQFAAEKGLL